MEHHLAQLADSVLLFQPLCAAVSVHFDLLAPATPFVKEKPRKKAKAPAALAEVTVADTEPTQMQVLPWCLGEPLTGVCAKY